MMILFHPPEVLLFFSGIFGGTPHFARKSFGVFLGGGCFCSEVSLESLSGFFSMSFRANSHMIEDTSVSLNGGTPKTPQNDHFSRKTHGCWVPPGKPSYTP